MLITPSISEGIVRTVVEQGFNVVANSLRIDVQRPDATRQVPPGLWPPRT
jgi:hypothetical protein